jgi:hypothetical protein
MTALRRTLALAAVAGLALSPAAAHAHGSGAGTAPVPSAALPIGVPTITSPNVRQIAGVPETTAISMEFARTGSFAYVSSLDTISVLDLKDPRNPVLRGTLVNALFENESMTYGERTVDGRLTRFVIAGIDLFQVSPDDPDHVNVDDGPEVAIVDVTDPDRPYIRGRTKTTTSAHTVQCVTQNGCRYAYTAGTRGTFSILDFSDLDNPREVGTARSSAAGPAGPNSPFSDSGAGHYWDFDGRLGWHTGSGGAQAFDVKDPRRPLPVTGTGPAARTSPYNDFILHNSMRPNAAAFKPGAAPSLANGNVLLVTEEDYFNDGDEVDCTKAGSFQTWYVPDLNGNAYRSRNTTGDLPDQGTVRPLDATNPAAEFGGGATTPVAGFCSAHWFDVHQSGIVALGSYAAGLRLLDVRDPRNIRQYGYSTGVGTEVWDAYWVPRRDTRGVVVPGQKTNLVYTTDAVRGIEVYEVTMPGSTTSATAVEAGSGYSAPVRTTG